jgi:hypothetical protein
MPGEHVEKSADRLLGELSADIRNIKNDVAKIDSRLTTIASDVEDLKEDKWAAKGAVWLGRVILVGAASGGTLLVSKAGAILAVLAK